MGKLIGSGRTNGNNSDGEIDPLPKIYEDVSAVR